jgi:hypothetical protein
MSVHVLPGRIRLRPSAPLNDHAMQVISVHICTIDPSAELVYSAVSGSVLITFRKKERTADILALLRLQTAEPVPKRRNVKTIIRYLPSSTVKKGMMAALLTSLGLIAMGKERGHVLSGGLFLLLLSRHLWVYRRRLLV